MKQMKRFRFEIVAMAMIVIAFTVGSLYVGDQASPLVEKAKTELTVSSALTKVEAKEHYKLDNAEYKSAVITNSGFESGVYYVSIGALLVGIFLFLRKLVKQAIGLFNTKTVVYSLIALSFVGSYFFPELVLGAGLLAVVPPLTAEEEEIQKALLDKVETKIKAIVADSQKENVKESDLNKKIETLNKEIKSLNEESLKELKARVDKMATDNASLQKQIEDGNKALTTQSEEIKKLKDSGLARNSDEVKKTFREALKDAVMEQKDKVLVEKQDIDGKRLSMKDYFDSNGSSARMPKMTIKVAVDMLESNIVQSNVSALRLTELDPQRVGIPLAVYPHVLDVFKVKSITRPNMALLVVYTYEDGAATKTEGAASGQSSFLFKTVSFPAFFIATYFTLSDETLDDLEEALDEINIVAPDKILSKIDGYVLGSAGDDVTAIAGILSANKKTDWSDQTSVALVDPNIVDVIANGKLQAENAGYRPNVVYLNPSDLMLLGAAKNTIEDSRFDRRVVFDVMGTPVSVLGLRIVTSNSIVANTLIVLDNNLPWIGRRKDMTMEIGHNGTDLVEGQKTVVIKIRVAFGVRDKAGIIYASSITSAIAALSTT